MTLVISVAGEDKDGSEGPDIGSQGCHFAFYPSESKLYLDGPNGGRDWNASRTTVIPEEGSSTTGQGTITNGYCTINAATSSWKTEQKILDLTLDVSFVSRSQHLHIYDQAEDLNSNYFSYGGNWYYWGWWVAP